MSVAWFLFGVFVGMFITLGLAWLSIVIERRQNKNEDYRRRFIQVQVDWILAHQPTDEEIREMVSAIPEVKKKTVTRCSRIVKRTRKEVLMYIDENLCKS